MIKPSPFLDPRGLPRDNKMQCIGGPRDGEVVSAWATSPYAEGGRYVFADTIEWSYVWVPDEHPEPNEEKQPWQQ